MADERDDTNIYDECADVLSDVPDDLADWEDIENQKSESEAESSEDSEILPKRIRRTLNTPIFCKTMSRNRFRQIVSFLHISDNNNKANNADRLFKVQFIIDYFSKKFNRLRTRGF